ncbi:phosphatidylinositol polyphosphate 5-phosphatase type IV [Ciona intestinalis]
MSVSTSPGSSKVEFKISDDESSSFDASSDTQSSKPTSALPAIPSSLARERNFLVGHMSKSKSAIGIDELNRYFPEQRLRLFVGTWNMQRCEVPENVDDFILPDHEEFVQDMYVVGVQEAPQDQKAWEIKLQETLGPNHVLAHSVSHGVLHLAVFVRRDLIWYFSYFDEDRITTRMISQIKTKGAAAMSFQFFGTEFLFLTSHFHSGETKVKERIDDYNKVIKQLQLPRQSSEIYKQESGNPFPRFDNVFWFGDLNFRISQPHHHMKQEVENPATYDIREALKCDQLKGNMKRGKIFHGFYEAPINFLPTYKFNPDSDQYDTSVKLRVPSYTDRILHRSKTESDVTCLRYNSVQNIRSSDHRPVYAVYDVLLKPGQQSKVPLSTGQFNRQVYMEAAKRRAQGIKMPQRSTVCALL